MQKLQIELKNAPGNASQVSCSASTALNREETLSVSSKVLVCNNPEVNLRSGKTEQDLRVPVLNMRGEVLMPTSPAKARRFVKLEKARVVRRSPFTIQLNYESGENKQDITLGIDSGYGHIGFSAVSDNKELACGELKLDGKTSERLSNKAMYRRNRRNKLWYRKPRFSNRKKKEGWLPPSVQRRYDVHLRLIRFWEGLLPITKVIVESGNFDIQKIMNPEISGTDYQQGDMLGYQNTRSYLMSRERGKCQLCKKEFGKGKSSHIHHIIERSIGGTDRPSNLAILHNDCHKKLHKKGLRLSPNKQFKAETFMSIIRNKFYEDIDGVEITYGYRTFITRIEIGIDKTHCNDAFVIARGTEQERCKPSYIIQKHRNNRILQRNRNGFAPSIRRNRYSIQPKDLVWIDGVKHVASGTQNNGTRVVLEENRKSVAIKKIEKTFNYGSFVFK